MNNLVLFQREHHKGAPFLFHASWCHPEQNVTSVTLKKNSSGCVFSTWNIYFHNYFLLLVIVWGKIVFLLAEMSISVTLRSNIKCGNDPDALWWKIIFISISTRWRSNTLAHRRTHRSCTSPLSCTWTLSIRFHFHQSFLHFMFSPYETSNKSFSKKFTLITMLTVFHTLTWITGEHWLGFPSCMYGLLERVSIQNERKKRLGRG